jgi:hypothetical protein
MFLQLFVFLILSKRVLGFSNSNSKIGYDNPNFYVFSNSHNHPTTGRAIVQAVSLRLPTAAVRVRAEVR